MKAPWTGTKAPPPRRITEYDLTEQELLVEILRHARGTAYAVYVLVALAVLGAIVGVLVVLASLASSSTP